MILKILEYNAVRRFCTRPYYDTVYCFYDNRNNLVLIAWSNLSEQQGRFAGFFVLSTTENKSSGWWNKQVLCIEKQARRAGQYKPTRSVKRNIFVTPSAVMNEKNGNPWYPKSLTENISIHLHYPAHAYNISKQGCRKALGTRYYDATQRRSKAKTKVNNTTDVQNKTKKKKSRGQWYEYTQSAVWPRTRMTGTFFNTSEWSSFTDVSFLLYASVTPYRHIELDWWLMEECTNRLKCALISVNPVCLIRDTFRKGKCWFF